ncbi:MFS transporter [Erwinia sp. V71]|uniref:MFS transporter n=1 Tax=Erwinia sp. V71 TaxID=3369424 RepID=UPI003F5FB320
MSFKSLLPWAMLFLAGICLRSGIASVAPVLENIRHSLQIDTRWLGLLTAIPVICMGVLSPLGHQLEQRAGLRNSMLLAFALLILGLLLRLDSRSFGLLLLTAACVGGADAIIRPLLSGFIKESFPQHTALAMSIYSASMGLGAAAAAWATPLFADIRGLGWQAGLAVWALPAVVAAMLWYYGSRDDEHHTADPEAAQLTLSRSRACSSRCFLACRPGLTTVWSPGYPLL